jgi:hypothetical protein
MKKYFNFAFLSAIALAGTFGLTACSSSDDLAAETNPNYDPNTKEVTVDFVFNVETGAPSTTRMSSSAVQIGTNTFRGIKDAQLFTYKLAGDGGQHVYLGTETADKTYDLNELIAAGALNGDGTDKSRRVLEMSLPTGTNTLMFWGRAMQGAVATGKTAGAVYGAIDFAPNSTLANAAFSLTKCVPDDASATGKTALLQYETLIAKVLNDIVNSSSTVNVTRGGKTVNKTLAWKDYVDFANNGTLTAKEKDPSTFVDADHCSNMSALGVILANTFVTLNTFKSSELRNGQGKIIAALIGDLNTLMNSVTEATPTTIEEDAAQAVASHVKTVISNYFNSSGTFTWKAYSEVVSNSGLSGLDKVTADLNKFPDGIFHLPPGATVMKYTAVDNSGASTVIVNQYQYMSQISTYAMGNTGNFNSDNYMYPAELCYFGNSPIRVTSDSHKKAEYPDGAAEWDNDDNWKTSYTPGNNTVDWTKDGVVQSTTRSVAMQENINYGTAMLKTTIAYESGKTSLKDNNSHIHSGEADNTIAISSNPFTLTGVLIGGQPQTVGWNYIVKTIDPNPFICMVYDRDLSSSAIPTPAGSENYTMVWDNYTTDATQNTVYVALELTNNSGQDFWGMNNLIRNGSSFYLIGKLDPTQASNTITWPTAERPYALPPYNNDGTTKQTPRIFIQDYMTTANFIIGEESLKQALVSVPDLRASHLSLGLSVDLSWSNGLSFESVLGQD